MICGTVPSLASAGSLTSEIISMSFDFAIAGSLSEVEKRAFTNQWPTGKTASAELLYFSPDVEYTR